MEEADEPSLISSQILWNKLNQLWCSLKSLKEEVSGKNDSLNIY